MKSEKLEAYSAFAGQAHLESGSLQAVVPTVLAFLSSGTQAGVLVFDNATGRQVEVDWRGSEEEVLRNLEGVSAPVEEQNEVQTETKPGRPKLGVVAREVTLLPRHWDWLATQRGGASVALRRLVDEARKQSVQQDAARAADECLDRTMMVLAGNLPGYEEATRAHYQRDWEKLAAMLGAWPSDIGAHLAKLAGRARDLHREAGEAIG